MYLVERSDTSCGIYLRAVFMTIFALDPETVSEAAAIKIVVISQ